MASKLRPHLTYANVVSSFCLFVVLGGTSYAVATGSIGSAELKDNGVRSRDVRNNDLRSNDVKDASLLAKDFKAGELPRGPKGDPGPMGESGPKGETGPRGPSDALAGFFGSNSIPGSAVSIFSLGSLGLDPGAFVVWANVVFTNDSADPLVVNCGLGTPGATDSPPPGSDNFAFAADVAKVTLPPGATQTVALAGALDLDASDTLSFDCYQAGTGSGELDYEDADVGATQVETLTQP